MQTAAALLVDTAFTYEELNPKEQGTTFQSSPLLLLLGLMHLQDILGWVDVPGLDLPSKCNHGISGALVLCTAVV